MARKKTNVTDDERKLREAMAGLQRELFSLERSVVSCCGATFAQCSAITAIGRTKNISLQDLADALNLDKSTVSRTVEGLVKAGLVARDANPDDRRAVTLALTGRGRAAYRDIEAGMAAYYSGLLKQIPLSRQSQVLESLELLLSLIRQKGTCIGDE